MSDVQAAPQPDRLRPPPSERFAGETHAFDLKAALQELRAEDHPARDGHRQVTIFQQSPVTHVLFAFDANGELREHRTHGLVTIHCLEGALSVGAEGGMYTLQAGQLLILRPDVPHDVRAAEASAMLLTVHMEQDTRTP